MAIFSPKVIYISAFPGISKSSELKHDANAKDPSHNPEI